MSFHNVFESDVVVVVCEHGSAQLLLRYIQSLETRSSSLITICPEYLFEVFQPFCQVVTANESTICCTLATAFRNLRNPVLLTGTSLSQNIEKSSILYAKQHSLPVFSVLDGYYNLWQRFACPSTLEKWVYLPNKLYVPSEYILKSLHEQGVPLESVGYLPYNHYQTFIYQRPSLRSINRLRNILNLPAEAIVVTVIHETGLHDSSKCSFDNPAEYVSSMLNRLLLLITSYLNTCSQPENIYLIVKTHPSSCLSAQQLHIIGKCNVNTITYEGAQRFELVSLSNVVLGVGSILLHEAALLGVPSASYVTSSNTSFPRSSLTPQLRRFNQAQDLFLFLTSVLATA